MSLAGKSTELSVWASRTVGAVALGDDAAEGDWPAGVTAALLVVLPLPQPATAVKSSPTRQDATPTRYERATPFKRATPFITVNSRALVRTIKKGKVDLAEHLT
jgi:hypothetical protein